MNQAYFTQDEPMESSSATSFAPMAGVATAMILSAFTPNAAAIFGGNTNGLWSSSSTACVSTLTLRPEEDLPTAVKSEGHCVPSNPIELVAAILKQNKLTPHRVTELSEGSVLYEFRGVTDACVEVYSTGEIVVVIKNGELRDLYEFTHAEAGLIKGIFRHAGLCA